MKFRSNINFEYTYAVIDWPDYLADNFKTAMWYSSFKDAKKGAEIWTRCGKYKDPIIIKMKIWVAEPF